MPEICRAEICRAEVRGRSRPSCSPAAYMLALGAIVLPSADGVAFAHHDTAVVPTYAHRGRHIDGQSRARPDPARVLPRRPPGHHHPTADGVEHSFFEKDVSRHAPSSYNGPTGRIGIGAISTASVRVRLPGAPPRWARTPPGRRTSPSAPGSRAHGLADLEGSAPDATGRAARWVVHARTLEVLDDIGAAATMIEHGVVVPRFTVRDRERTLITIGFDRLPTRYPFTLMVPQNVTDPRRPGRGARRHRRLRLGAPRSRGR